MWDDDSGVVGAGTWVIAGGDTVVIRGCAASVNQVNASNPDCRVGWDNGIGGGSANLWCQDVGSYTCYNPPIPAGTAAQHTRILGACAYGSYTCTNPTTTRPGNLTQIFGGFSVLGTLNLQGTQYVDVQGIEVTAHNGACVQHGSPAYPANCSTSSPLSDFANTGILTNNTTANVTMQDVYVHGFTAQGLFGPIGGPISMTRVFIGFNGFAGWLFDDGSDTPDAPGSSITASYVTMEGNGCYEQYPIVNTQFPAQACYDSVSNGFGDAWSGQDTELDSFTCDHCVDIYNTKDAFIGPHTQIASLRITNSYAAGNMGAQWKWGATQNSTVLFQDNLTVTNCLRMTEALPGAAQNFNQSTGMPGSYLTNFCRAGGAGFANLTRSGSTNDFYGNTFIGLGNIVYQVGCGYYSIGNVFNSESNCNTASTVFKDNNMLGYTEPGNEPTAFYCLLYANGSTCTNGTTDTGIRMTNSYNNEYGLKGGTTDTCGVNNITCVDPLLVNEPAPPFPGTETSFDVFNPFAGPGNSFYPASTSPLIGAGVAISGLTTDYYGMAFTNPPVIGAIQ
jgi:hypothetical protein